MKIAEEVKRREPEIQKEVERRVEELKKQMEANMLKMEEEKRKAEIEERKNKQVCFVDINLIIIIIFQIINNTSFTISNDDLMLV